MMRILYLADKIKQNFDDISDYKHFIYIFFLINIISLLLKLVSVKKIILLLAPTFESAAIYHQKIYKSVKYTDFLLNISFLYFDRNCLKRTLVLFHILRKQGVDVIVKFGVQSAERKLDYNLNKVATINGHAWLTLNNEIYLEKNPESTKNYTVVFSYP